MNPTHRIKIIILTTCFLCLLSGCSISLNTDGSLEDSVVSSTPYQLSADTTEQILSYLHTTMSQNQTICEIYITDKNLIDADLWLSSLPGIEEIHCGYKKIDQGYNIQVSLQYWDNYPIVYAYRNQDTSILNSTQLELYNKYCDVLEQYTSDNQSDYQKELAIHDYLVSNIEYVSQSDTRYNAYQALINGEAVCSGYTECFKTFMDLLNIENYTISGISDSERHIWNEVKLGDDWYQVDVTWDDPVNGTNQNIDHSYFNITDADMALDHSWETDQTDIQPANGTKYSYANIMGLLNIESQSDLDLLITNSIANRSTYLEFQSTEDLDIKTSMSLSNITLSYSYKIVERVNYTLYTVTFSY